MSEFAWPLESPPPEEVRQSWPKTVAALPAGTHVTGHVIGRQRFGVFVQIKGHANAVGLAEVRGNMPHHMELPQLGAEVGGWVVDHADHNHQVKIRLDEWTADPAGR
ncbi:hypothetical protein GCM10011579_059780 [Streptomyces albiflavescens]|uniref:RNA-binding protein n=1 Tax=Streptomyces albiflavescens TaxID=1623582 RepID=A0A917Y9F4_9ACTN|nr:hypothetical protein [Streptomyces albiflavescens]GGN77486.1 hypothetical protein GCM10011579_059780 [Streptomyces albiflavescens]